MKRLETIAYLLGSAASFLSAWNSTPTRSRMGNAHLRKWSRLSIKAARIEAQGGDASIVRAEAAEHKKIADALG